MAITKMVMLVVVVVGLLAMVQQSVQMSDDTSMLRETGSDLAYWGIVVSRKTSERAILDSGDFVPGVKIAQAGRVFQTGTLIGRHVVLVNTGKYSANVASALQSLLSTFRIRGVLYLGLAADLIGQSPLPIGSVVVPKSVAFTAIWDWQELLQELIAHPDRNLVFGDFDLDGNRQNALGLVRFNNVTLYTGANNASSLFYLETDEDWLKLAKHIEPLLPEIRITVGGKGASSDMTVKNGAYASFLYKSFGFKTVDQESSTVALVSKSNDVPYIVFHGISNGAYGAPATEAEKRKAAKNAYRTLRAFLAALPEPPLAHLTTYV